MTFKKLRQGDLFVLQRNPRGSIYVKLPKDTRGTMGVPFNAIGISNGRKFFFTKERGVHNLSVTNSVLRPE